jgi:hypothetical protein
VSSSERLVVEDLAPALADPSSRVVLARRLVREGLLLIDIAVDD